MRNPGYDPPPVQNPFGDDTLYGDRRAWTLARLVARSHLSDPRVTRDHVAGAVIAYLYSATYSRPRNLDEFVFLALEEERDHNRKVQASIGRQIDREYFEKGWSRE